MQKITIAFDVDGTLSDNTVPIGHPPVANEDIRTLLITLSKFKNVTIIVWSGSGELFARQTVAALGLQKYVDKYASKNYIGKNSAGKHQFNPDIKPDICIDDIQDCVLGTINLIVREK